MGTLIINGLLGNLVSVDCKKKASGCSGAVVDDLIGACCQASRGKVLATPVLP